MPPGSRNFSKSLAKLPQVALSDKQPELSVPVSLHKGAHSSLFRLVSLVAAPCKDSHCPPVNDSNLSEISALTQSMVCEITRTARN